MITLGILLLLLIPLTRRIIVGIVVGILGCLGIVFTVTRSSERHR